MVIPLAKKLDFWFSGKAVAYAFDDVTGGLVVSHKYVLPKKDYPGTKDDYWTPNWMIKCDLNGRREISVCFTMRY